MKLYSSIVVTALLTALPVCRLWAEDHKLPPSDAPQLGLLRLKPDGKPQSPAPLNAATFTVDDLAGAGAAGVTKGRKDGIDYLALEPGKEWSRPLRVSAKGISFISFQLFASINTVVEMSGVRLGVTEGPIDGDVQLMFDDSSTGELRWRALNVHLTPAQYGGKNLVRLPTFTVRIDPLAGVWDLYTGSRLLADSLPLIPEKRNQHEIVFRGGTEGAWITGLVTADENPLYEDDNANGIDDRFERDKRGALLAATAAASDRKSLAAEWKDHQLKHPPAALFTKRPRPDHAAKSRAPKS